MSDSDKAKRVVIKIGTNILSKDESVDSGYVGDMAGQGNSLLKMGKHGVIVTSGEIWMGAGQLKLSNKACDVLMTLARSLP